MKVQRGQFGYISSQKKRHLLGVLIFVVLGIVIFIGGLLITRVKANVFTVFGILMVLPAAKHLVAVIVMIPYKSVGADQYEEISKDKKESETLLTDCVITSTDKVMELDFIAVSSGRICALVGKEKQDVNYIRTYLSKGVHNNAPSYEVDVVEDYEAFKELHRNLPVEDIDEEEEKRVIDYLYSLIVQ